MKFIDKIKEFFSNFRKNGSDDEVLTPMQMIIQNFRSKKLAMFGLYLFLVLIIFVFVLSWIFPYNPLITDIPNMNTPPFTMVSTQYDKGTEDTYFADRFLVLGSDRLGRDTFFRIIEGTKFSLKVSFVGVTIATLIGVLVGSVSGYVGGRTDNLLMRFAEIVRSIPFLPLAITLSFIIKQSDLDMSDSAKVYLIMVILGLIGWTGLARMIRGQILSVKESDFILAAKALGIKTRNIILRHILPNVISIVIVSATLGFAGFVLTEAGLSFLGFGADGATQPSLGNLLTSGQTSTVIRSRWWLWIPPGFMLFITVLSINLIGDGLRDAIDPKSNDR